MTKPESISDLLGRRAAHRLAKPISASMVLSVFRDVCQKNLPPTISGDIQLISYADQVVKIRCHSGAVAQEIKLKERLLIDAYNQLNKGEKIKKLRILFG
ncbi:MAG: DciA family protein [Patescibacteria group bacterium]